MTIDFNKKGKLERLTKYYISFRGDYFVYCKFIKDLELISDFTDETKIALLGMNGFCQRQFTDSMVIKLSKLVESSIFISKSFLDQKTEGEKIELKSNIDNVSEYYKKSNLKTVSDKIVAHLDTDFLKDEEKLGLIRLNFKISKNEEYEKILELVGDLINLLSRQRTNTEINYPKRTFDLANQLVPIIIGGYRNFYIASKAQKNKETRFSFGKFQTLLGTKNQPN